MPRRIVLALALCIGTATPLHGARIADAVPVWPHGPPAAPDWPGQAPVPVAEQVDGAAGDPWSERVWNVTRPTLLPVLPESDIANGAAVIIAPGGGFRYLAFHKEGTAVARWLAQRGFAAFVLKYRTIQRHPGETVEGMRERILADPRFRDGVSGAPALADGMAALKLVRARAGEWGIDPRRVGVIGFSAGGHVSGAMALALPREDRPAFAGLIYGMPFFNAPAIPPANLPWPPSTPQEPWLRPAPPPAPDAAPPMFLAMAQDDLLAGQGVRAYYDKLYAAGYRPEFHLYAKGGHGFGMKPQGTTSDGWVEQFHAWLVAQGFDRPLPAASTAPPAP